MALRLSAPLLRASFHFPQMSHMSRPPNYWTLTAQEKRFAGDGNLSHLMITARSARMSSVQDHGDITQI